jgi:hypothetical protein
MIRDSASTVNRSRWGGGGRNSWDTGSAYVIACSLSPPHTRVTCWANRLAWQLAQLCIFTAHDGKTTQQQHNWQNHLHFPPSCSKSHEETMVSHWLIDSSSSAALSSQHPQTLRFFLASWKISNTIHISLKASRSQILTKTIYIRTYESNLLS